MNTMCPKCLCEDATVALDISDGDTLRCRDCDEEYTLGDIEALVASWGRLLPWLRAHPARQPECGAVKVA